MGPKIQQVLHSDYNCREKLLGVPGILSEWKAKLLLCVQKRTCCLSILHSSSQSSFSGPLVDLDQLKSFQRPFLVTLMNKCSKQFIFECGEPYISSVFFKLSF